MMSVSGISYGKNPLSIQPEESNGKKNLMQKKYEFNLEDKTKKKRSSLEANFKSPWGEVLPH